MSTAIRRRLVRRTAALGSTGLIAAAALVAAAGPASAGSTLKATYKISGSTFLAGPMTTLALGPGKLTAKVTTTGKLTATLSLPPATASFTELGVIPVTATAKLINDGPTTGTVNLKTGTVSTTSKITMQITSLTAFGQSIPVGTQCETATPVVVSLKSQKGFSVLKGGKVAGTYTIPKFHHCGLATVLINLTVPASGNTITLKLGKAKIG